MDKSKHALRYSNYINSYVYDLIPERKKILDVGCNSGNLGAKIIQEKKGIVWGIDYSNKVVDLAKKKLNFAKVFDLESYELPFVDEKFDLIIFADVLEHLRYPEIILSKYQKMLKSNGRIIVSIPNIANIYIRFKLLRGCWNYTENGILDKTHFKFFTHDTLKRMLTDAGYEVEKVDSTPGYKFIILRSVGPLLRLQEAACKIYPKLFAKQFIMVARKR